MTDRGERVIVDMAVGPVEGTLLCKGPLWRVILPRYGIVSVSPHACRPARPSVQPKSWTRQCVDRRMAAYYAGERVVP